jgi:IS5 family transposase
VSGRSAAGHGRPTIAMATYVRLMVVKQRSGWGYETLVREVSDSLHLRRFCLIAIDRRVPDESTVRKLTRRLGPETVAEICRLVIAKAQHETRFQGRAVRVDSTVTEGRHPLPLGCDARLAGNAGARQGGPQAVGDRQGPSGAGARSLALCRAHGAGDLADAGATDRAGEGAGDRAQLARRRADGPVSAGGAAARGPGQAGSAGPGREGQAGRGGQARAARRPLREGLRADRPSCPWAEDHRPVGVALRPRRPADPQRQARQADRVRLRRPGRRGDREHPSGGARVHFAARHHARQPGREPAASHHGYRTRAARHSTQRAGRRWWFQTGPTLAALPEIPSERIQLSGRHEPGSRRTRKRRARYRTGIEGRISHLKRGYGLRRSRLKGHQGQQIWAGWAILTYNLDTLAIRTP